MDTGTLATTISILLGVFVLLGGWFYHVVTVSNQSRRFRAEIAHLRGEYLTETSTLRSEIEEMENAPPVLQDNSLQFDLDRAQRALAETEAALEETERSLVDHQEALRERDAALEQMQHALDTNAEAQPASPEQISAIERERDSALKQVKDLQAKQTAYELGLKEAHTHLLEAQSSKQSADHIEKQISRMEDVWLDLTSNTGSCRNVLHENLWIFWPDYVLEKPIAKKSLAEVATAFLKSTDPQSKNSPLSRVLMDITGWTEDVRNFRVEARSDSARTLMFVKLENPVFGIDEHTVNEIYDDLKRFRALSSDLLNGLNIDCLVVAGHLEGNPKPIRVATPLGGHANGRGPEVVIRIIPITYQGLIERAKRLQELLVVGSSSPAPQTPVRKGPVRKAPAARPVTRQEKAAPRPTPSERSVEDTQGAEDDPIDVLARFREGVHRAAEAPTLQDHDPVVIQSRDTYEPETMPDELDIIDVEPEPEASPKQEERGRQPSRRATFLH